jgi:hypothetical protein
MNASATPILYADIVYDSTTDTYWANIEIDDFEFTACGFHLNLGTGWKAVNHPLGGIVRRTNINGNVAVEEDTSNGTGNVVFVAVASSSNIYDDETLVSIQIAKTENYSTANSNINIFFEEGDMIANINTENNDITDTVEIPQMYCVEEFVLGDIDNDDLVNSFDSSRVLNVVSNCGNLNVYNIRNSFLNYFPNSLSAAAADVNKDGYITNADADTILNYYCNSSTGSSYNGGIGKKDLYEVY